MLPPTHLYAATIKNEDGSKQSVEVTYKMGTKTKTVTKDVDANGSVSFASITEKSDDGSSTSIYAIESIKVGSDVLNGPFVDSPTDNKAFKIVSGKAQAA